MFVLFSKDNCPQCLQLEGLLKMKGKEFTTKKLDKDYTREDLDKVFADLGQAVPRSFPMLFKGAEFVGTLNEAKVLIAQGKL